MEDKNIRPIEYVYAGIRVNDKGKRVFYWAEAGNPSTIHVFTKQIVPASVGGVYLFH